MDTGSLLLILMRGNAPALGLYVTFSPLPGQHSALGVGVGWGAVLAGMGLPGENSWPGNPVCVHSVVTLSAAMPSAGLGTMPLESRVQVFKKE